MAPVYIGRSEALSAATHETLMLATKSQRAKMKAKVTSAPQNGSETFKKLLLSWDSL